MKPYIMKTNNNGNGEDDSQKDVQEHIVKFVNRHIDDINKITTNDKKSYQISEYTKDDRNHKDHADVGNDYNGKSNKMKYYTQ